MAVELIEIIKGIGLFKPVIATYKWAKETVVFWFNLKKKIKEIEKKAAEKPASPNARLCPNCDTRMKMSQVYGEGNWYKCPDCGATQWYKTKH